MQVKENKSGVFNFFLLFVGLLLGFFLGGVVVYWVFDRQNDRLAQNKLDQIVSFFSENDQLPPQEDSNTTVLVDPAQTGEKRKRPATAHVTIPQIPVVNRSPVNRTITSNDSVNHIDTTLPNQAPGSVSDNESLELHDENQPEFIESVNVVVVQDQLLATRKIAFPVEHDIHSLSENLRDTLLGNPSRSPIERLVLIEFWESPLNSFGYRMGKNKIAIYGIRLFDFTSFLKFQGQIYLKYLNDFYPLEISTTFRPLIPVRDPYLIEQLR